MKVPKFPSDEIDANDCTTCNGVDCHIKLAPKDNPISQSLLEQGILPITFTHPITGRVTLAFDAKNLPGNLIRALEEVPGGPCWWRRSLMIMLDAYIGMLMIPQLNPKAQEVSLMWLRALIKFIGLLKALGQEQAATVDPNVDVSLDPAKLEAELVKIFKPMMQHLKETGNL